MFMREVRSLERVIICMSHQTSLELQTANQQSQEEASEVVQYEGSIDINAIRLLASMQVQQSTVLSTAYDVAFRCGENAWLRLELDLHRRACHRGHAQE